MACGALRVLCSVGVVSEGYDEPSISAVVLLRPTASKGLYVQQVGRGLRGYPAKADCLVLDFVQATVRHGPVTQPIVVGVGEGEGEGGCSAGSSGSGQQDEATVARAATAARMAAAAASAAKRAGNGGGGGGAPPPPAAPPLSYQKVLAQETAKARSAALKSGKEKVWICDSAPGGGGG